MGSEKRTQCTTKKKTILYDHSSRGKELFNVSKIHLFILSKLDIQNGVQNYDTRLRKPIKINIYHCGTPIVNDADGDISSGPDDIGGVGR